MKVSIEIEDIKLEMVRATEGEAPWTVTSTVDGQSDTKLLNDAQAAATAALVIGGSEGEEMDRVAYDIIGNVWDGSLARPIP